MRPLVIDLDGTLLRSDLLLESALCHAKWHPLRSLAAFGWLLEGKAHLKERLAAAVELDIAALPYDAATLDLIRKERAGGRQIVLATASHMIYARQIAAHLNLFDRVLATEGRVNLAGAAKRDALIREFGQGGFDYVGNSMADLQVWQAAHRAYLVNPEAGVEARARSLGNVEQVLEAERSPAAAWLRALRLHQWAKNLLVFVPLLASHRFGELPLLLNGLLAFLLFSLCASSVYILNDLLDLADDRHHSRKRERPFASGALPIKAGFFLFPILLIAAFAGTLLLPWKFALALAVYYSLTVAYSLVLKRIMVVDVVVLAILYTLRIIAGTFALGVALTFWMLAFSMFIFLSLALVKRYAELADARQRGQVAQTRGRGYFPDDLPMISALGAAAGYLSVMVLALYIQERTTASLYSHPELIWLACPMLLFWITRVWMLAHRGKMADDPVVFAIKDRASLVTGALFGLVFWLAA